MNQKQLGHPITSHSQPNTPGFTPKPPNTNVIAIRQRSLSPNSISRQTFTTPNISLPAPSTKQLPHSRSQTDSPSRSLKYVNVATQTEDSQDDDWYKPAPLPKFVRRPYISLTKRLLLRYQKDRERLEAQKTLSDEVSLEQPQTIPPKTLDSPSDDKSEPDPSLSDKDVKMLDAEQITKPELPSLPANIPIEKPRPPDESLILEPSSNPEFKPPPEPGQTATSSPAPSRPVNGYRNFDVKLQQQPSTVQSTNESYSDPSATAPSDAVLTHSPSAQFPANPTAHPTSISIPIQSGLVQPSPIKKKISLGEYYHRRQTAQNAHKAESLSTADKNADRSPGASSPSGISGLSAIPSGETHLSVDAGSSTSDRAKKGADDSSRTAKEPKS